VFEESEIDDTETKDEDYTPERKKECKYRYNSSVRPTDDGLPDQYQFIRHGQRSVRPEVYSVMQKLSSKYHMSKKQIEGAIIEVANGLFGRNWKPYSENNESDPCTLPSMKNILHTEPNFEAMALCAIVEEIMEDGNSATVVYSNDGSSRSGVGSYVVQSFMVNGIQRCLPTFGIYTESRESLKDLEILSSLMKL
jgi:hypothetical protein